MGTTDRSLGALKLFSLEKPIWTAEEAAKELQVSISTAYRYLLALDEAGLIAKTSAGRYVLGPAIIQLDRQIQLTDPLLIAARPVMTDLAAYAPSGSVVLLCRSFGDNVLCMHQVLTGGPQSLVSYERGRPMPMFQGATAKIILPFQPTRQLKALYMAHRDDARKAGLGETWEAFRAAMANLRKAGYAVSRGEVDQGRIGIAVALLDDDRHAIDSLSFVVSSSVDDGTVLRLAGLLQGGAREIELALRTDGKSAMDTGIAAAE